ncbi:UDP-N-acetyl-D-galactosamine dehydrogenase [Nostoc calcicola FACHB-389]|nr:nucleotide sugar dehydrogenase [Nostoc calcicola FACHB-3891]OKH14177.1 UDP-N-acetyl-D-galactosamine dehydrogenase [Nostoc calcicola FACHB-389]
MTEKIAVIGLGYVGLPLALALAKYFPNIIGFDINSDRINQLQNNIDSTGEINAHDLRNSQLIITNDVDQLKNTNFFIIAVPTPIDACHRPDLISIIQATKTIASVIKCGAIIVYESTVYPGVTEGICGKLIAEKSGLKQGIDFKLGYSPERINFGDKNHTLEKIVKVVAGEDKETLEKIAQIYRKIIKAGVYKATSIKVAEMAKVIENTQRDLNIALMNEIAIICDKLEIRTSDVLAAAKTKWNFLPFTPGLVGGHCIGVDPYYLTAKAEELGYYPEVILAGRRINDSMGQYLGQKLVKLLVKANLSIKDAKVGILGITFKENISDIRNSKVIDLISELKDFGIHPLVHDPLADHKIVKQEYDLDLVNWRELINLDAIILAVPHLSYIDNVEEKILSKLKNNGVLMDVKSVIDLKKLSSSLIYWSL